MNSFATITSKRQFTIPVKLFKAAHLQEGQKVTVVYKNGDLLIRPAGILIKDLAGSVSVPKRFQSLTADQIIQKAKREYFKKRRV